LIPYPTNLRAITHFRILNEKLIGVQAITSYGEYEMKFCSQNYGMCVQLLVGYGISIPN